MDVHHLRYFCAVADAGTFAAAAQSLSVAASPLARRVRDLELHMGAPLFIRGGRKLRLTEKGKRLLPAARKVLDAYAEVEAQRAPAYKTALLKIGLVPGVSLALTSVLEQVLADLRPLAEIEYVPALSQVQNAKVLSGELDFATVRRVEDDPRLLSMVVASDELVLLTSPKSLAKLHSPLLPGELNDWTLFSAYTTHFSQDLDAVLAEQKVEKIRTLPRADFRATSVHAQHDRSFIIGMPADASAYEGFLAVIDPGRRIFAETKLVWRRDRRDLGDVIERTAAGFRALDDADSGS